MARAGIKADRPTRSFTSFLEQRRAQVRLPRQLPLLVWIAVLVIILLFLLKPTTQEILCGPFLLRQKLIHNRFTLGRAAGA